MTGHMLLILLLVVAAFLLGRYLRAREIPAPGPERREIPTEPRDGDSTRRYGPAERRPTLFEKPWMIAILVMLLVNGLLFLLLGPRGGLGLFLFLPLMFGLGRKRR